MINSSNLCVFEGRIAKDPVVSTQGQGQNTYTKALFTIAVERKLSKEQRDTKKNGGEVTSADFIPMVANGSIADVIDKYFVKGKPIKVVASYQAYQTKDANGNAKYGHIFKAEDIGFVLKDNTDGASNGGGNNGSRNNNNNGARNSRNSANDNSNDFVPVDDNDIPF